MRHPWTCALILVAGCTFTSPGPIGKCDPPVNPQFASVPAPRLDHHQHLLSKGSLDVTLEWLRTTDPDYARQVENEPLVDADQLVKMLDDAGIAQALVFSNAYYFSRTKNEGAGEYEKVKAENDWTLSQVSRHPTRLYAACSVNPLRGHAVVEIERCAASGGFKALKIHFDASGVDLTNPEHVASARNAFTTANRLRLPIIVHLQSAAGPFGPDQARTLLSELLPSAPDVPVTLNHLWGGGMYGKKLGEVLTVFTEAVERKAPGTANLYFDVAQASMMVSRHKHRDELVGNMRQLGFARLLYGSDGPEWSGIPPKQHWEEFAACMPMTRDELGTLASNVAPYLR